jgi:solute carrier family 50 protein (sugar transporter)
MLGNNKLVKQIFGWSGAVLATYFYIAPCVPFYKLVNEQIKVNEIPGFLLICSFMNCILWADYGLLDNAIQVYFTNGLGGAITLIWITTYLIYLGKQNVCFALILIILLMIAVGGISFVFYFIISKKITGLTAMVFNVLMYAAPGEKILKVCKTKQYNLIPIFSTIGGFFCSLCWLMFGIIKGDINMIIPNALGLFFAILQAIVYTVFYCKKKSEDNFDIGDDDKLV